MSYEFEEGDRVYHKNLKLYGTFIGYAWESSDECDVDFTMQDGEREQLHVSVNQMLPVKDVEAVIKSNTYLSFKASLVDGNTVNKRVLRIRPIERHYEDDGEEPIIGYGCPICESLGTKHSFHKGMYNCPLCGINLEWGD